MKSSLAARRLDVRAERLLFAMVANRALAPFSKLACCEWLAADVAIPGLEGDAVGEDPQPLYRAMDWLLEIEAQLAEQVYWATADLLNLKVDLLFFDTTSTYFERDEPDAETVDDDGVTRSAFRTFGHSKDSRDDLPQVVIGMAVTRTGIPIRAWCWPGNASDQPLIRQVKDDLREWKLSRVVWSPTAVFSRPRTAATCNGPAGTTSSARSSAASPPRPRPRSRARAATARSRATCRSRRCASMTARCATAS